MPNYPTSLDNTTTLPSRSTGNSIPAADNNDKNSVLIAIETKLGTGSSVAGGASTGQVLAKNGDGTTSWQNIAGGGASPATFTTNGTVKQREYNVKDYSVTGNGTTDDTAAINSLISTISAAGGGVVYFPAGSYKINTTNGITPANNVSLIGAGMDLTTFLPYGTNPAIRLLGSTGAALTNVRFADFGIDGTNQAGTYTSAIKGFYIQYLDHCVFENIHVRNTGATGMGNDFHKDCFYINCVVENGGRLGTTSSAGAAGIGIGTSSWDSGAKFIGCVTRNNKRAGIFFESQDTTRATNHVVVGHTSDGNEYGIGDAGCDGLQVIGGVFRNSTKAGVTCYTGTLGTGRPGINGLYSGCDVSGNGTSGFTGQALASGNRFLDCRFYSNTAYGMDFAITSDLSYIKIVNCEISANANAGIKMGSGSGAWKNLAIKNNRIYNNGTSATDSYGIMIVGNVTGGTISNNECFDDQGTKTQGYGLAITAGTFAGSNTSIRNNDFRSNLTGAYIDTGATIGGSVTYERNLGLDVSITKTADYTVTSVDRGNTILVSGVTTITLPAAVSKAGFRVTIQRTDSTNTTTVATTSSQTINGATTQSLTTQYQTITVESNGTNWNITSKA